MFHLLSVIKPDLEGDEEDYCVASGYDERVGPSSTPNAVQDDKDVEQGHTHAKSRSCSDYIIYTSLAQCTVPVLGCLWNLMLMINFFLVDEYSPPPTQTIFLLAF